MTQPFSLIDINDSVLIVIDAQDVFLRKLDATSANSVVERIRWLVQVAQWFKVPLIVTAENLAKNGPTTERIRSVLPVQVADIDKRVFGLAGQRDIVRIIDQIKRKTAILVGLETDVCVQQSAMGLAEFGYSVFVVADAVASPDTGQQFGLERMRRAGIGMVSCKSLFYEWARDLETVAGFSREAGIETPGDLSL